MTEHLTMTVQKGGSRSHKQPQLYFIYIESEMPREMTVTTHSAQLLIIIHQQPHISRT